MAQLFDFKKVTVGPRTLTAVVELAPSAPLMTSDDPDATGLVLALMPALADHVCLGDAAPTFGEVVADTELAHLLEHVAVELLAQTDVAGDIASGQTTQVAERTYEIALACVDDILVAGALSSAAWVLQWAYSGGGDPRPDIQAIAGGLAALVQSVSGSEPAEEPAVEKDAAAQPPQEPEASAEAEPSPEQRPEPEPALADPEPVPEPESEPDDQPRPDSEPQPQAEASDDPEPSQSNIWDFNSVPRPHTIR